MNIFDAGGITTAIAVIATIIIGTGIFALINTIFEIWYLGFGAMVGEWLVCCVISAFIVNWFTGIILGFFSVLWFLIKVVAVIAAVIFIYQKFKSKKGEGDTKIEEGQ